MTAKNNKNYNYTEIERVEYLKEILKRLNDDVGTCLKLIKDHNQKNSRKIGYWISIRIIMPIVETISRTLGIKTEELLKNMGIDTPYLMWDMFRNSLMHSDQLSSARYENIIEIGWSLSIESFDCFTSKDHIHFDASDFLNKLRKILEDEIKKNDRTIIKIPTTIRYKDPDKEIINEFKFINSL